MPKATKEVATQVINDIVVEEPMKIPPWRSEEDVYKLQSKEWTVEKIRWWFVRHGFRQRNGAITNFLLDEMAQIEHGIVELRIEYAGEELVSRKSRLTKRILDLYSNLRSLYRNCGLLANVELAKSKEAEIDVCNTQHTDGNKTDEKKQQNPKYFRHKLPDSWEEAWEMEKDPEHQAAKKEFLREMKEQFTKKK